MTTSTMMTTIQWHYGMNGISTKKMNGIHTWEMMIGIHTRKKAYRCWLINLLHRFRRVNLLCHLSKGATFDSITFLCGLQMFLDLLHRLLRRVSLLHHLSQRATSDSITFLYSLQRIPTP